MKPQRQPQIVAPTPEQTTQAHLNNALMVVRELHSFLFPPVDRTDSIPRTQELDGEAKIAASATFVTACSRIDALLNDGERWSIAPLKDLYAGMNACYEQQFEFLKSQTLSTNQLSRPSFLLKPDLAQLQDGAFIAYWGDISTPGAGLVGRGATPAAAFSDFDAAYYRQEQIRVEPPAEEIPPTPPAPQPKPRSKKK